MMSKLFSSLKIGHLVGQPYDSAVPCSEPRPPGTSLANRWISGVCFVCVTAVAVTLGPLTIQRLAPLLCSTIGNFEKNTALGKLAGSQLVPV
jgi:hypothetical protein